jgi:hypothetical protein
VLACFHITVCDQIKSDSRTNFQLFMLLYLQKNEEIVSKYANYSDVNTNPCHSFGVTTTYFE